MAQRVDISDFEAISRALDDVVDQLHSPPGAFQEFDGCGDVLDRLTKKAFDVRAGDLFRVRIFAT